jgi:HlyD family secretion protein
VGSIDSIQLYLKKKQLEAQIKTIRSKTPQIAAQTGTFKKQLALTESQINTLLIEKRRTENLLKVDAATPKQLDDINGQLDMLQKQLEVIRNQDIAQTSALSTQKSSLLSERSPLQVQIEQIEDQLAKCKILNPLKGTVLTKYIEANEMAIPGKPLYKIADLAGIIMRAYITGDQLSRVKLNQKIKVLVDDGADKYKEYEGVITWISDKAEFTPKTIQTKEERANMVYAIKAIVKNDGLLKIGMYAEVKF